MADLYIAELSIDPEEPHVGEQVQLRVVVRNGGNARSGSFGGGASSTVPWTLMVAWQCGPLAPGEEHVLPSSFTFSEPGLATITARIGIGPMGQDSNEENNTAELVVNVLPGDLPDLYIGTVSLNPSSPQVGQQVQVAVSISNIGTSDAGPLR
jgi:subtilase family serine protease